MKDLVIKSSRQATGNICTCTILDFQVDFTANPVFNPHKGGLTGLMVRASDFGSGDPGSILGRVGVFVSLSKRHLLPKSTGNTQE